MKRKLRYLFIALTIAVSGMAVVPSSVFATCADNSSSAIVEAPGALPRVGCGDDTTILETIIRVVFGFITMLSILFIVIGGIRYSLSGGDGNAIASAKKTILYAVVGLSLGLLTFVITSFVFRIVS